MTAPPAHPRRTSRGPAPVSLPAVRARHVVSRVLERWASRLAPGGQELVRVPSSLVDAAVDLSRAQRWGDRQTRDGVVRLLLLRAVTSHRREERR